jgi:hypothetical protein
VLGSREQKFNGFVEEDEQCCHGSGPVRNGFDAQNSAAQRQVSGTSDCATRRDQLLFIALIEGLSCFSVSFKFPLRRS